MELLNIKIIDNSDLVKNASAEAIYRALSMIGLEAEKHAKLLCPVITGRLMNSITHVVDDDAVYIGTNVEYAASVELGLHRKTAKPYLKPAIVNNMQTYKNMAETELKKG